jgi:hypothetical protein
MVHVHEPREYSDTQLTKLSPGSTRGNDSRTPRGGFRLFVFYFDPDLGRVGTLEITVAGRRLWHSQIDLHREAV